MDKVRRKTILKDWRVHLSEMFVVGSAELARKGEQESRLGGEGKSKEKSACRMEFLLLLVGNANLIKKKGLGEVAL